MAANRAGSGALARRFLGTFLSLMVLGGLALPGAVTAGPKEKLEAARSRLEAIQEDLAAQRARLAVLQGQLAEKASELVAAEAEYEVTQRILIQTRRELQGARDRMESLQRQLDERAAAAYIGGTSNGLEFLLAASSLAELSDRVEILDAVSAEDGELAEEVANEAAKLRFKQRRFEQLRRRQQQTLDRLKVERADLQSLFDEASSVKDEIQRKLGAAERAAKQARIDFKEWKEEQAAAAAAAAAAAGGSVPIDGPGPFRACPVGNPHGVSNSFGAPRVGHLHAGVDIFAPYNTPVIAPFDGVAQPTTNGLGGYAVYVRGAAGYVYNAHLSRPAHVSGSVRAGQVIGYVGTSGNAVGTSPHNHFEWHPNAIPSNVPPSPYGYSVLGDAVNPYPYLMQPGIC